MTSMFIPFLKMSSTQSQILIRQQFAMNLNERSSFDELNVKWHQGRWSHRWERRRNVYWLQLPIFIAITGMALPREQQSSKFFIGGPVSSKKNYRSTPSTLLSLINHNLDVTTCFFCFITPASFFSLQIKICSL